MAAVLRPPSHTLSTRSPLGRGILLNPSPYRLPSALPPPSYPSRSNQSLSSSTSSSEDVNTPPSSDHATPPPSLLNSLALNYTSDEGHALHSRRSSAPEYGSRRIRFAPLPDPRRAVCVTEGGEELPLPSVFIEDDSSGIPHPNLRNFNTPPSLLLGDSIVSSKKLPTSDAPGSSSAYLHVPRHSVSSPPSPVGVNLTVQLTPSTATATETACNTSASSTRLAKRLFKPFRQRSDDPHRTGSRDSSSSRDDTPSSFGIPLGHWASADEVSRSASVNGEPLSRARSATAQPKPKRMLNGRVYGARKNHHLSTNLFQQNIPDEEPEFVEWGYGGMGSVRSGGMWSKVQSDQRSFLGHTEDRGRRGAPQAATADEDDGSGMGWVKKRREERERKKREELAASETASKTDVGTAPTPVSAPVPVQGAAHDTILVSVDHEITTVTPLRPGTEDDDESSEEDDGEVEDESSSTEQEGDDGDQEQHFKQVLGAGVERISRHHRD